MSSQSVMKDDLPRRRWYDNRGYVSQVVELLYKLPLSVRPVVLDAITGRAEERWGIQHLLKSVGKDKILAIHQAKKRRRKYDKDQDIHRAIHYFFILSEPEQDSLAVECLQFTQSVVEYIANCQKVMMVPKPEDFQVMKQLLIEEGIPEVRYYIEQTYPEFAFARTVISGDGDMRIHSQDQVTKNNE